MNAVRVACYARFSSDLQRATSIDDQLATATRYAHAQGWTILPEHVYTDAAVSGASLERPGVQALRTAAMRRPAPFDVLLVDDSSRVSRDLADAVRLLQELRFAGIRVIYISQNIDSASEQAETLVAVHGVVDSLYLREMAKKIKRGLAGQIARGFATGGRTFGYRTVPIPDPTGKRDPHGYPALLGKRLEVVPEEARTIVQIFQWYADGLGSGRLVERLSAEHIPGLHGLPWKEGALKRALANEKYTGKLIWGKTTYDRRPGTRQLVQRHQSREHWHVVEDPALRIVSDDLWARVQARRAAVRSTLPEATGRTLMRGRNAALHSRHLFSGFMTCGVCGGAMAVVTGGYGSPRYGCLRSWRNGRSACGNRLTIRAKVVDAHLLTGLRTELLRPATVQYVTEVLSEALNRHLDERPAQLEDARAARTDAQQRLRRLTEAIETGGALPTLLGAIREREADIARLDQAVNDLTESAHDRLAVMPGWVRQRLEDTVSLLSGATEPTKVEFQRLALRVTMTVILGEQPRPFYRAVLESALPGLSGESVLPSGSRASAAGSSLSGSQLSISGRNPSHFRESATVGASLLRPAP